MPDLGPRMWMAEQMEQRRTQKPKIRYAVDTESGTFFPAENLRFVEIYESTDEWWHELPDSERIRLTEIFGVREGKGL